jgi:hypothetical protein
MRIEEYRIADAQEWLDKYEQVLKYNKFGKYIMYAVPFDDMTIFRIQGFFMRENRKGISVSIFNNGDKWFSLCVFGRSRVLLSGKKSGELVYLLFSNDVELWLRLGVVSRLFAVKFPVLMSKFKGREWVLLVSKLWERYNTAKCSLGFGRWMKSQQEVKSYEEYALSHFARRQKAKFVSVRERKVRIGPLS